MMVSAISSGLPTRLSGTVAAKYSLLCYFSGTASGMSARAAFAPINVILHRGCAAETDRSDNFSIHFDGKSAAPRRHILIHHRLVSLVLGLNSHVYSLWVAVT